MNSNTIGQFIAALRKAQGLTQQYLADKLNVSNKAVSRWERDECAPDITLIPPLAELLGVTCDELLKGTRIAGPSEIEAGEPISEPKVEKQVKRLIQHTVSRFRTLFILAIVLSALGFLLQFVLGSAVNYPIPGFICSTVCVLAALALTWIGIAKGREVREENELFAAADANARDRYHRTLCRLSYAAVTAMISAFLLSLPNLLLVFQTGYHNIAYSVEVYFTRIVLFIGLAVALLSLVLYSPYCRLVIGHDTRPPHLIALRKKRRPLNLWQWGTLALIIIIIFLISMLSAENNIIPIAIGCITFLLMAGLVVEWVMFLVREKEDRTNLFVPGLRNVLLLIPVLVLLGRSTVSYDANEYGSAIPGTTSLDIPPESFFLAILSFLIILLCGFLLDQFLTKYTLKKRET